MFLASSHLTVDRCAVMLLRLSSVTKDSLTREMGTRYRVLDTLTRNIMVIMSSHIEGFGDRLTTKVAAI